MREPKILFLDIETSLMQVYTFSIGEQFITHEQIKKDWQILSWAAKWKGFKEILYQDCRGKKSDKDCVKGMWKLMCEADVIITQNGKRFDAKKLNSRFIQHGLKPPSPYRHIDTLQIKKKHFGFTSNKLAYTSNLLCPEDKKYDHKKFPGLSLWVECEAGNTEAWDELKKYNIQDVVALEKLYEKLAPWDNSVNLHVHTGPKCKCGSLHVIKRGFGYTVGGKYQNYQCRSCGTWTRDSKNLLQTKPRRGC